MVPSYTEGSIILVRARVLGLCPPVSRFGYYRQGSAHVVIEDYPLGSMSMHGFAPWSEIADRAEEAALLLREPVIDPRTARRERLPQR